MACDFQNRGGSGIGDRTWEALERAAVGAAKSQLTARRFIPIEGPHGLGVQAIPLSDEHSQEGHTVARLLPLHFLFKTFRLSQRDIAAYEREPLLLDSGPAARAAIECARGEEELLFNAAKNPPGLAVAPGIARHKLVSWQPVGKAATDIADAVGVLDAAGFTDLTRWPSARAVITCCTGFTLMGTALSFSMLRRSSGEGCSNARSSRPGEF